MGMFVPAGTPPEIIARLQSAVARALESGEIRAKLTAAGMVPVGSSPQLVCETINRETKIYGDLAKSLRNGDK